jgi:hypothetical protein
MKTPHTHPKTKRADRARKAKKVHYKITNWKTYNQSLINRGSLTLWISDDAETSWYGTKEGRPGCPKKYSDRTIELSLTMQQLYQLPLRAWNEWANGDMGEWRMGTGEWGHRRMGTANGDRLRMDCEWGQGQYFA